MNRRNFLGGALTALSTLTGLKWPATDTSHYVLEVQPLKAKFLYLDGKLYPMASGTLDLPQRTRTLG